MIRLERLFLTNVTGKHINYNQNTVHLSTTDKVRKHYEIQAKFIHEFLNAYAKLLDEENVFHFNVILNSLVYHNLVIDVDFKENEVKIPPELVQSHIVSDLINNCVMATEIDVNSSCVFDCIYLQRSDSRNYHLVFPYLFLDRCDYVWLIDRAKSVYKAIDNVQGWMLYGSTKVGNSTAYRVTKVFDNVTKTYVEVDDYIKKKYPGQPTSSVWTNLLYPGMVPLKEHCSGVFKHIKIVVLLNKGQSYPLPKLDKTNCRHLLTINESRQETRALFSVFVSGFNDIKDKFPKRAFEVLRGDLFEYLKLHQSEYEFSYCAPEIGRILYKFHPAKFDSTLPVASSERMNLQIKVENEEEQRGQENMDVSEGGGRGERREQAEGEGGASESDPYIEHLVHSVGHDIFPYEQVKDVAEELKHDFRSVWDSILSSEENKYTTNTILYNLCYKYGIQIPQCKHLYIPETAMSVFSKIFVQNEIEWFSTYLVNEIFRLLPVVVQSEKNVVIFNWSKRKWDSSMTLKKFLKTLVTVLIDYVISQTNDREIKKELRKARSRFIAEHEGLVPLVIMNHSNRNMLFDMKPWIVSLNLGITYDIQKNQFRLTLPEDYSVRGAYLSEEYRFPSASLYEPFLDQDKYMFYYNQLRLFLEGEESHNGLFDFKVSDDDKINRLFVFLATIFCEEYDVLKYFLLLVSDCLIGRNYRRWFCMLIGDTSNAKSSLLKLLTHSLGNYASTMSPEILYQTKRQAEAASPEFASKMGVRSLLIEEVSPLVPINIQYLCSLSGECKQYARALFQDGQEFNVTFRIIFTTNDLPNMKMTPAVLTRLHIIKFKSIFTTKTDKYNFSTRVFPQIPNLDTAKFADCFLGLLINTLQTERQKFSKGETGTDNFASQLFSINIPASTRSFINEYANLDSDFSKWERMYVVDSPGESVTLEEVKSHLRTYLMRHSKSGGLDSLENLLGTFCKKYNDRLMSNEGYSPPLYVNMTLLPFGLGKKMRQ